MRIHKSTASRILTHEAFKDREAFTKEFWNLRCTCWMNFWRKQCQFCQHPGNPKNQENDDKCWWPSKENV